MPRLFVGVNGSLQHQITDDEIDGKAVARRRPEGGMVFELYVPAYTGNETNGAAKFPAGKHILHMHTCENDRCVPGGGLVPWASHFDSLYEVGFDGPLVMEAYNSSIGAAPGDFAYSRGMFHNVCPDGAAFVRSGLAFLKESHRQTPHAAPIPGDRP